MADSASAKTAALIMQDAASVFDVIVRMLAPYGRAPQAPRSCGPVGIGLAGAGTIHHDEYATTLELKGMQMSNKSLTTPLMLVAALAGAPAIAQLLPEGLPSPETIANADKFKPPMLTEYSTKLARQPDMTGLWAVMKPKGAGVGPTFDPVHTFWPPQPVAGEALFGPVPGTYIKDIPYNAEYQKKYQGLVKETTEGKSRDTFAACVPYGVPRMIGDSPVPFDIIQSPEVMFWYNDYGRTERRIFLDGRQHPTMPSNTGGFGPSSSGHSIGRWEGNTLVVDTVDMIGGYFDETPAPYSDRLHMVERIRLIAADVLEDQMTFTDPVTMNRPWVVTSYFLRITNLPPAPAPAAAGAAPPNGSPADAAPARNFINLADRPCVPNVRIDANGFQVTILPQELETQALPKAKAKGKGKSDSSMPQQPASP